MSSIEAHLPILQVLVPLIGALLSAFFRRGTTAWAFALLVSWIGFVHLGLDAVEGDDDGPDRFPM